MRQDSRILGPSTLEREAERAQRDTARARETLVLTHQEITLVYICRIRMRLYVIKSLNDIYMSNNV